MTGVLLLTANTVKRIEIDNLSVLRTLFGNLDVNVRKIEDAFGVQINSRDGEISIGGAVGQVEAVEKLLGDLIQLLRSGERLDEHKVDYAIQLGLERKTEKLIELLDQVICVTSKGRLIKPKTSGQHVYYQSIMKRDVTLGIGPAGTGKTFLAVAMAVRAFKNQEVSRIIITRPAVEAGENLGFLPGDLQSKVDPYLRPLYDALYEILGVDTYLMYKEKGLIEVAPLAYMRGRTLDNAFIILDEAQNTTINQMKMFLTRFGYGSKVVVNGDITQQDLPDGKTSGLVNALAVLKDIPEIGFVALTEQDVVRHRLVKRIITAYESYEKKEKPNVTHRR